MLKKNLDMKMCKGWGWFCRAKEDVCYTLHTLASVKVGYILLIECELMGLWILDEYLSRYLHKYRVSCLQDLKYL